ncbi:ribonuclease R [candidate division KSB1 bacterium]|nr:ribonuclease R [candidate division KSB1 bacterium]
MKKKVVDLLASQPSRRFKAKEIARALLVPQNKYKSLKSLLHTMVEDGTIGKFPKNRFGFNAATIEVSGILHVNSQGYGFVRADSGSDVFVSQKNMGLALHKDIVRVRLFSSSQGSSPEGKVIDIIERARNKIVGTFRHGRRYDYVIPQDVKIHRDIIIPQGESLNAIEGQIVVSEIDLWEDNAVNPFGKVVEILGFHDDPGVDVLSIIHSYSLPLDFPPAVKKDAEKMSVEIPALEIERRMDLRDHVIFTIDPEDAKDFDDAVSLELTERNTYLLGVHIADVSYYVSPNSLLDREASERGTSVYFVDRVIPMLPEKLSNQLCSLAEGQEKLCFSIFMELDPNADLLDYQIKETVICSKKRFNYIEAQSILDQKTTHEFAPVLNQMYELSLKLIKKRRERGSIDFESPEVEIKLDDKGSPIEIGRRKRLASHRLIEEFMLLANETVARSVGEENDQTEKSSFVFRVHEKPDDVSVDEFLQLVNAIGFTVKKPKKIMPRFFQLLAEKFPLYPTALILNDALLRTMMKARYTTVNTGHFGLAYSFYTHFTSPIRRYPDLLVHRLLKQKLSGALNVPENLDQLCQKATDREIRAQEVERAGIKLKQVQYLEQYVGKTFTGIICRIVMFGFFVRLEEFLVDGLVHVNSLDDDYYIYNENTFTLEGARRGKKYRLGDRVKVQIDRVDRNERLVDFVIKDK